MKSRRTRRKLSPKERNYQSGCVIIFSPSFQTRKSPSYPAKFCRGRYRHGNDKHIYKSVKNRKGIYRWKKIT